MVSLDLPTVDEVMRAPIKTREVIGFGILPIIEREFNKCGAAVLATWRIDAWDYVGLPADTPAHIAARRAWIEWLMFAKAVMPVLPGGKAKQKRNQNLLANLAARWAEGERMIVWEEALQRAGGRPEARRSNAGEKPEAKFERKRLEVISLAERGLPGKAIQRATSQGMAANTPETETIIRAKFPAAPVHQSTTPRALAPPSNELTEEGIAKAIHSFARGVAPGPSGHRPDFYKQIIGELGDRPGCAILTGISNLLADGRAPKQLRPYLGGARGVALHKTNKNGGEDARPACSGEAIRRIVGKALLATEIEPLRAHLLPLQLAIGVKAGVEAMPHLARQWLSDHRDDPDRVLVNSDESNAHNKVDRHTFLMRMREIAPRLSRWLEWV